MLSRIIARTLAAAVTLAATVTAVLAVGASPAAAQTQQVVCGPDGSGGQICVLVVVSTSGGGNISVDVSQQSHTGGSAGCVRPTGNPVTCQHQYGWYSASLDCYIQRAEDLEPAPGHRGYDQHGDDGVVYYSFCFTPGSSILDDDGYEILPPVTGAPIVLAPGTPAGYGGPPPSPLPQLIEDAINSLQMDGADIGMAPSPGGAGLVGLPVWMWTTVSPQTWGEQSETAGPALGIEVTATATSEHIEWNMGDSSTVTCPNPGTPYDISYGVQQSPTCGYAGYRQPSRVASGGRFGVTATTTWTVAWQASTGDLGASFTVTTESSASVLINEMQVLVTLD